MVKIQVNSQGKAYLTSNNKVLLSNTQTANIESLNVTPSTIAQTITASGNVDGYSPINVSAVTSSIDNNIVSSNIKNGVEILGVTGNVVELNGTTITITPSTTQQIIEPVSPLNGITQATVAAVDSSIDSNIVASNIKNGVTILGVTGSANILNGTTLNVTPTTSAQTITPTSPNNGFTEVDVSAVTSSIDNNITASNIKKDVTILGVTGNYTGGGGSAVIDELNVTPTTSAQVITVPSGTDGYNPVNVSAVTSSIDNNIIASNIKNGITILGVTGNYTGSGGGYSAVPSYEIVNGVGQRGSYTLSGNEFSNMTSIVEEGLYHAFYGCSGLTGSLNLSSLTTVGTRGLYHAFFGCSGLTGSLNLSSLTTINGYSLAYAFYGCSGLTGSLNLSSLTTVPNYSLNYAFYDCRSLTSVDLSSVTSIGNSGLQYAFNRCSNLTSVDLSSLTSMDLYGLQSAFYSCTALTNVNLSSLTTVGNQGLASAFSTCRSLQSISFPKLTTCQMKGLANTFDSCTALENVYFNALTTSSFSSGSNHFQNMMSSTGTNVIHTLHFPSNLESTIQGLTGYPLFGGTSDYVVLAFDLPATN